MSNEQQELLDEAYEEYKKRFKDYWNGKHYDIPTKETFINRLKNQEDPLKEKELENQYIVIDLRTMEIMRDKDSNIKFYDTEEDACLNCGIYELENVWVMKLIYNHIEDEQTR